MFFDPSNLLSWLKGTLTPEGIKGTLTPEGVGGGILSFRYLWVLSPTQGSSWTRGKGKVWKLRRPRRFSRTSGHHGSGRTWISEIFTFRGTLPLDHPTSSFTNSKFFVLYPSQIVHFPTPRPRKTRSLTSKGHGVPDGVKWDDLSHWETPERLFVPLSTYKDSTHTHTHTSTTVSLRGTPRGCPLQYRSRNSLNEKGKTVLDVTTTTPTDTSSRSIKPMNDTQSMTRFTIIKSCPAFGRVRTSVDV